MRVSERARGGTSVASGWMAATVVLSASSFPTHRNRSKKGLLVVASRDVAPVTTKENRSRRTLLVEIDAAAWALRWKKEVRAESSSRQYSKSTPRAAQEHHRKAAAGHEDQHEPVRIDADHSKAG